ncbi:hypothetical protein C8R45DRAFT_929073 [Mycena sanguinolenta]|nr:hypothetical protein C8R45DRAFT_929073 [Mycena sanguinolenta]
MSSAESSLTPDQAAAYLHELPLNSPIVEVFMNGFYTCLFILTLGVVCMSNRQSNQKWLWSTIVALLYFCATVHSSTTWEIFVEPIQEHGASPDVITALLHPNVGLDIFGLVTSAVSFVLADIIMIWRCWIVWGRSWLVVVLPILAAVGGVVCAGLGLAGQISVMVIEDPTASQGLAPLIRFSTPFLSLSLAATLYTTGLIAWRILGVQRYAKKNGIERSGPGSDLSTALEIMVESSSLYAASLFIFIVLLAMKSENQTYMQNIHAQIAGIAPTLLILRISAGQARTDEEWTRSAPVSTLRFGRTMDFTGAQGSQSMNLGDNFDSPSTLSHFPSGISLNNPKMSAGINGEKNSGDAIV